MIQKKVRRGRALRIAAGFLMLGLLLSGVAEAATPISSCGTISSPGEYILTQNINNFSMGSCIAITSSDVVFDGAGYMIGGAKVNYIYGVYVYNLLTTLTNITVKNLEVTGWYYGIYYRNIQNGSITGNNASFNGNGSLSFCQNTTNCINNFETTGISLGNSSNITIINNTINSNNQTGISIWDSSNNTISNNNIDSNEFNGILILSKNSSNNIVDNNRVLNHSMYGIEAVGSSNNYYVNNRMEHNGIGIKLGYLKRLIDVGNYSYEYSYNNTLINNTASLNDEGFQLITSNNNTIIGNYASSNIRYGIVLHSSSNFNTMDSNTASYNNHSGITLDTSSNYNILKENNANLNNNVGISIKSNYNILTGNIVHSNNNGMSLTSSRNNILTNNIALSNKNGIILNNSNNNILTDNLARSNKNGIILKNSSESNTLSNNTASFNIQIGIGLENSSNNTFNNNFFNNSNNFEGINSVNTWNITKTLGTNIIGGSYLGGNVWANPNGTGFSKTCLDIDNDGICDSFYQFDINNTDYLPLAYRFTSTPTANVSISGFSFQPQTIIVAAGTTVNWTNFDSAAHTVSSDIGLFDSGSLSIGQTFSRIFNTAGSYDYHCSVHPSMTGSVIVTPGNPPPASISNPQASSGTTWINWSWNNPQDNDFSLVMLYLNGTFLTNVYSPQNYYNTTGLLPNTSYELGTHTVDSSGNVNQTWVNKTARTAPMDGIPVVNFPEMTNPPTDPDGDGLYEDINGNGRKDFNDVVVFFNYLEWVASDQSIRYFDFNGNGRMDFNDIIKLFSEL